MTRNERHAYGPIEYQRGRTAIWFGLSDLAYRALPRSKQLRLIRMWRQAAFTSEVITEAMRAHGFIDSAVAIERAHA